VNNGADANELEKSIAVSVRADEIAQESLESVNDILTKLPKQETSAKTLPLIVTDLNKGVQFSESQRT